MSKPIEIPYVHHRVIHWGDTDAARIAYTVRFFDYALEAIEGWWRALFDLNWYRLNVDLHMGTPFVQVQMDFHAPLNPRHELLITVLVDRLGGASLAFRVEGRRSDGVLSFSGRLVCCMVSTESMQPIPVPDEFRTTIEQYIAACTQ